MRGLEEGEEEGDGAPPAPPPAAGPSSPARSTAGRTPMGEALAVAHGWTAKRAPAKRRYACGLGLG